MSHLDVKHALGGHTSVCEVASNKLLACYGQQRGKRAPLEKYQRIIMKIVPNLSPGTIGKKPDPWRPSSLQVPH